MYGAAILTGACGKSKGERRRGQGRRGGSFLRGQKNFTEGARYVIDCEGVVGTFHRE